MGIFNFFSRKPKQEIEKPIEDAGSIDITGLNVWLNRIFSNDFDAAKKESKEYGDNVHNNFLDMKKSIENLQKAVFEGDEKIFTSANMVKDTFVKKSLSTIQSIQPLKKHDYSSMKEYLKNSSRLLSEIKTLSPKQRVLLSKYFNIEAGKVISDISAADSNLKKLSEFLDSKGKSLMLNEEATKISDNYILLSAKLKVLEQEKETTEQRIEEANKEKTTALKKIKDIMEGDQLKEMENVKKNISDMTQKSQEIESKINQEINSIKRPLKKLQYERHSDSYTWLSNPLRDIFLANRQNILRQAAQDVLELAEKGKLIIKKREREKIMSILEKEQEMKKKTEEYRDIKNKISEKSRLLGNFAPLLEERKSLQDKVTQIENLLAGLENQKSQIIAESEAHRKDLETQKIKLEKLILEFSNKKVHINYSL